MVEWVAKKDEHTIWIVRMRGGDFEVNGGLVIIAILSLAATRRHPTLHERNPRERKRELIELTKLHNHTLDQQQNFLAKKEKKQIIKLYNNQNPYIICH